MFASKKVCPIHFFLHINSNVSASMKTIVLSHLFNAGSSNVDLVNWTFGNFTPFEMQCIFKKWKLSEHIDRRLSQNGTYNTLLIYTYTHSETSAKFIAFKITCLFFIEVYSAHYSPDSDLLVWRYAKILKLKIGYCYLPLKSTFCLHKHNLWSM